MQSEHNPAPEPETLAATLEGTVSFEGSSLLHTGQALATVQYTLGMLPRFHEVPGHIGGPPITLNLTMGAPATFNHIIGVAFGDGVVEPMHPEVFFGTAQGLAGPTIPDTGARVALTGLNANSGITGMVWFNGPSFLQGMPATAFISITPEPANGPVTVQGPVNGGPIPFTIPLDFFITTFNGIEATVVVDSIAFSMPVTVHFGSSLAKSKAEEPETKVRVILTNAIITDDDPGGNGGLP